jgi:hypothetical protein
MGGINLIKSKEGYNLDISQICLQCPTRGSEISGCKRQAAVNRKYCFNRECAAEGQRQTGRKRH